MGRPPLPPPGNRVAWKVVTLPPKPMARCAVLPALLSTHRNGVRSGMEPCGSCMLLALAIVVPVHCGTSVSGMGPPAKNHDALAPCCIPEARHLRLTTHRRCLWLPTPSCGETGSDAPIDGNWSSSFATSGSTSDCLQRPHRLSPRPLDLFLVQSGHTTDSPGPNVWLAMPLWLVRLPSPSPCSGYRTLLPLPWACRGSNTIYEHSARLVLSSVEISVPSGSPCLLFRSHVLFYRYLLILPLLFSTQSHLLVEHR